MQVREKFTLGFIIGVRYVVTRPRAFSCDLTNSGHYRTRFPYEGAKLANFFVICNSILLSFEAVRAMPTAILAAVATPEVIGSREDNEAFGCVVVIIVG